MQPMLDDPDLREWHVPHLAHHHTGRRRVSQIGPAPAARCRQVVDHLVRVADDRQREAGRAGLFARLTRRTPPLPGRSAAAVRRRRHRRVPRVLAQLPGQVLDLLGQRLHLTGQRLDLGGLLIQQPGLLGDHDEQMLPRQLIPSGHPRMIATNRPITQTPRRTIQTSVTPVTVSTREWFTRGVDANFRHSLDSHFRRGVLVASAEGHRPLPLRPRTFAPRIGLPKFDEAIRHLIEHRLGGKSAGGCCVPRAATSMAVARTLPTSQESASSYSASDMA